MALLSELSGDLHAKGMKLYVSVQAGNADFDYPAVAALADGVIVMNYDEHRSEEHTSELQSRLHLVCRLLLEKKKKNNTYKLQTTPMSQRAGFTPATTGVSGTMPPILTSTASTRA